LETLVTNSFSSRYILTKEALKNESTGKRRFSAFPVLNALKKWRRG